MLMSIALLCSHSLERVQQSSESSWRWLFRPQLEHQTLLWRSFPPIWIERSPEPWLAPLKAPISPSLNLPMLLCPSPCATFHTISQGQLAVIFLVCMYLFTCWALVTGEHMVSRMKKYSFFHLHLRLRTSFQHWHELNFVHQPSEMCDLCLLFSLCIVCALCCVCLRNKPLISSGRWVQHVPSFLCLPECLCFWV